jgi:hypothetical protein
MLLTNATIHRPATELGHLMMKDLDKIHPVELLFGHATVGHLFARAASNI